jgi:hypothetical protein
VSLFRPTQYWDSLSREDKQHLRLAYQRVFDPSNSDAMLVLSHMLSELKHFREAENDEDVALQNYSKRLMRNTGLWVQGRTRDIVRAYAANARLGIEEEMNA